MRFDYTDGDHTFALFVFIVLVAIVGIVILGYSIMTTSATCHVLCANNGLGFSHTSNFDVCVCTDYLGFDVRCVMNANKTLLRCLK